MAIVPIAHALAAPPPPPATTTTTTMLLLGLTGSIATGKSSVAALLAAPPYSLPVLDADALAHAAVAPGTPGHAAVVARFAATTPALVRADGALDRAALGARIFRSAADRAALDAIVHPRVRAAAARALLRAYCAGAWAVVLDVPLLFETRMEAVCGAAVVVGAGGAAAQARRLRARDPALTDDDARARIASQWSVGEKVAAARAVFGRDAWVVDNSGDRAQLRGEVARVMGGIARGRAGAWRVVWGAPPVAAVLALWRVLVNRMRRRRWDRAQAAKAAALKAKL